MTTKRYLALVLALVLVVGVLAGCAKKPVDQNPTDPTTTKPTEGTVTPATYTYNYAMSEFPTNWSYTTYQTATDSEILDYITDGFYSFDYNATKDGYQMVDAMAIGDPKDVTAEFVGKYGIQEGDKAKAYVITLRQDLQWEDGTPIKAQDFVESAKRLLDPKAQNYRADGMYAGSVVIVNAESYLKQGQTIMTENNLAPTRLVVADLVKGADGVYKTADGADVRIAVNFALADWLNGKTLKYYVDGYGAAMFDVASFDALMAKADDNGLVPVTDETLDLLTKVITFSADWGETAANIPDYLTYDITWPEVSWDNVGWFAKSDYELCFIMENELSGFYLKYNLPAPLVHIATYDACTSIKDGVYSNTYGTSVETTKSYGPYKLTSFQTDKQFTLTRNEKYYGLTKDTYQTTDIVVDYVKEAATRLQLFRQGKLDTYGLTIDDMKDYQLSDFTYYSTGDSTFAMVFNPNLDAMKNTQAAAGENKNKTIITLKEFRMAMSFALDRNAFCLATSPLNAPGFGLFSSLIVSDPESGTAYRTTDTAKNVLANFWGVADQYGDGKLYKDIDEAIASITGYNLTKAKELFNTAYDMAIAQGLMDADDVVEIKIGTPNNTSAFYNNGYEFLVKNYTDAVKGTKLEGKLTFTRDDTLGNAFSSALKQNKVDMLFGVGWTGSALDPYGLMEAYISPNYQYDPATDFKAINVTIKLDGVDYTASASTWLAIMNGQAGEITAADGTKKTYSCGSADGKPEERLEILGALEGAVLQNYNFIPIMDDAGAQLRGRQVKYYTEEYIFGMGFGGIKYYTYEYSDADWDAYVKANNGMLDYT